MKSIDIDRELREVMEGRKRRTRERHRGMRQEAHDELARSREAHIASLAVQHAAGMAAEASPRQPEAPKFIPEVVVFPAALPLATGVSLTVIEESLLRECDDRLARLRDQIERDERGCALVFAPPPDQSVVRRPVVPSDADLRRIARVATSRAAGLASAKAKAANRAKGPGEPSLLTDRQQQGYAAIVAHMRERQSPPTVRDLGAALGVSVNAAMSHLKALNRKGWIVYEPHGSASRSVRLVGPCPCPFCGGTGEIAGIGSEKRGEG